MGGLCFFSSMGGVRENGQCFVLFSVEKTIDHSSG